MTVLSFRSAGVSIQEIDQSGPTAIQPTGIPAACISPTPRGPAFVPGITGTTQDYQVVFGAPTNDISDGPLMASEWLSTQQAFLQIRVLGAGSGKQRITSGNNKGSVTFAGFVAGSQQPQQSLSGALGNNPYANASSLNATGSLSRTYLLGCFMSQSAGSTYFSDAGLQSAGVSQPIVRAVLMAASGVMLRLSSSLANSLPPSSSLAADFAGGTVRGALTGSLKLTGSLQEFVLMQFGHKGTDPLYPNVITASFDPLAPNYVANMFNTDPLKLEQAGHYLYSYHDINSAVAVPTGSGVVLAVSGSAALNGFEQIAFLVTGSQTRNSGTLTAPNYENFEDRYTTPSTPWITSQKFGGKPKNLFRVWSLSDGAVDNRVLKVSIENIAPSPNLNSTEYGTFDVVVRQFNDTDGNRVELERFRLLTIDPDSPNYIARVIGDVRTFFNFDTSEEAQKVESDGLFENRSKFIRVEIADDVDSGEMEKTAIPMGFRGPQHLVTSGSAPLPAFTDAAMFSAANPFYRTVQPPVPFRMNLNIGGGSSQRANRSLYWGIQFEKLTSVSEPNSSTAPNKSLPSFTKFFPMFQTEWQNFAVRDNQGVGDTTANGIMDADRFNNNGFSLENIKIKYNTSSGNADVTNLTQWSYVRSGSIPTDTVNGTRALRSTDLSNPTVRTVAKFTVWMEGGFDGTNVFNYDQKFFTNNAVREELNNTSRGLTEGPTVKSYIKALDIVKDTLEVDCQLLAVPDIREQYITDYTINVMETDRLDCMYVMDIEQRDLSNNVVTDVVTQDISVTNTITQLTSRGLNSSYTATYFPDVIMRDRFRGTNVRVPPSVVVMGAFGKNDQVGYAWNAAAGFTRGVLPTVDQITILLSQNNLDELQDADINPLATFAGQGPVVWGQKTLLATPNSSFDRVNVRRLLIALRRQVKRVGLRTLFQPARATTLESFRNNVTPILKRVQDLGGVEGFRVDIDTTTTTPQDFANKIIRGKIFIIPTKTLEFLDINFVIRNAGSLSVTG